MERDWTSGNEVGAGFGRRAEQYSSLYCVSFFVRTDKYLVDLRGRTLKSTHIFMRQMMEG